MAFTEYENIKRVRTEASKAISENLLRDIRDKSQFVEALIRTDKLVESSVSAFPDDFTITPTSPSFGDFDDVLVCHALVFTSGKQKNRRIHVIAKTTGATPDLTFNENLNSLGVLIGDTFKVIYCTPDSHLGHTHNGLDSENIPSASLAIILTFQDMFS